FFFFFSSRRRHTRFSRDWSSDVCSSDLDRLPYDCGAILSGAIVGAAPRSEQARAEAGVTGCHGAIAETGSLALISGPGCSRTVRSEERSVGKECRSRWLADDEKKKDSGG